MFLQMLFSRTSNFGIVNIAALYAAALMKLYRK